MRLQFKEKELIPYLLSNVSGKSHEAYFTYKEEERGLFLSPNKSTATLQSVWTILETRSVESEIRQILSEKGVRSYRAAIDWDLGLFVFREVEEFLRWIEDHVAPKTLDHEARTKKYRAFFTQNNDVTLAPGVSTKPMKKAYISVLTADSLQRVKTVLKNQEVPIFFVERINWREDRLPGPTTERAKA
jgi:hypothetical protein